MDLSHADLNVSATCFDAFGGDCRDAVGHGTHVAGVVAALANGVVGVAPGATVYSVKVLDEQAGGGDSHLLSGIEWVLNNATRVSPPIRVVNMSLGRPGSVDDNPALGSAIHELIAMGIVVVTSAGNDPAIPADDQVPAASPAVITVASSTALTGTNACPKLAQPIPRDTLSYFSSYAPRIAGSGVDITAPGARRVNVGPSCVVDTVGILSLFPGDSLAEMAGTSMAAPLVAGVAALLLERNAGLTPAEIGAAIVAGATAKSTTPNTAVVRDSSVALSRGILSAPGALNAAG